MSNGTPMPPRLRTGAGGSSQPRKAPQAKKPRKKRTGLRVFFAVLIVIILVLGIYVGKLLIEADGAITHISSGAKESSVPSEERAQVKPLAFVLLGLDSREATGSLNTDVIMVAAFNPKSDTATIVSIPRDSNLELAGYRKQKVNQFYAGFLHSGRNTEKLKGKELEAYARDQEREMLAKFLGIEINYTTIINFKGFVDVVDKLGGIDVYVDQDMKYKDTADGTDINLKKGQQVLNGEKTLDFVRYRKSKNNQTPASSDFARNERQSQVLGAIMDKMKTFGGAVKLGGVIDAAGKNTVSDIPSDQIKNLLKTYYNIDRDHLRFIPLTGVWKSPYVYLDEGTLAEAKQALAEELSPDGRDPKSSPSPKKK